jgi:putative transposase
MDHQCLSKADLLSLSIIGGKKISAYQSIRDALRRLGISTWIYYYEKYLDAMYKRDERLRHLYITAIRFLADELYRRGVRKLYIGYPYMLSQDNGHEYNTNIWWFRKIVLWIVDVFREYGIEVELVPEDYTSQRCSICGAKHKDGRVYRGLYICRKTGKKINVDINATLNIARRLGHEIRITRKIESYLVTHSGVKPLIPHQRANTRDPSIETSPLNGGEGVIIAAFVAAVVLTVVVEYYLYGAVSSVFDTYLDAVSQFNKFVLTIAILIIAFPLLLL